MASLEALVEGVEELAAPERRDVARELERLEKSFPRLSIGNQETVSMFCPCFRTKETCTEEGSPSQSLISFHLHPRAEVGESQKGPVGALRTAWVKLIEKLGGELKVGAPPK